MWGARRYLEGLLFRRVAFLTIHWFPWHGWVVPTPWSFILTQCRSIIPAAMTWLTLSYVVGEFFITRGGCYSTYHDVTTTYYVVAMLLFAIWIFPHSTTRRGWHFPTSWSLYIALACNRLHHISEVNVLLYFPAHSEAAVPVSSLPTIFRAAFSSPFRSRHYYPRGVCSFFFVFIIFMSLISFMHTMRALY